MRNSLDLEGSPQDTRVVVAMSGGVDSSVTAALLKAEGYDVVGVTLQLYDHGAATHRKGACCAGQDIHDARAVAEREAHDVELRARGGKQEIALVALILAGAIECPRAVGRRSRAPARRAHARSPAGRGT